MKQLLNSAFFLSLLCLAACHKDHGAGPGTTSSSGLKLDLISSDYGLSDTSTNSIELIISEPGGKVLLDTITPANTHITANLNTTDTLVDLTNIYYDTYQKLYSIQTHKSVNPSSWSSDAILDYYAPAGPHPANLVAGTLTYTNVSGPNEFFFQNMFGPASEVFTSPNTITETLTALPGNYAYILFPASGLYKMNVFTGNATVDCFNMDTAVSANFTPSSYFSSYSFSRVYGYTDSTNLNSEIELNFDQATQFGTPNPELLYPAKNIQKYAVLGYFSNGSQEQSESYTYGNTVNTNITYPDPNSYTLGSTQNNNFTVSWKSTKPTYYFTTWSDAGISWELYANPDSTTLDPVALLTAQNPKMLKGHNFTDLTLSEFLFENVQGYNYSGFQNLACDSVQIWKNRLTSTTVYYKLF
jgi:hypothetical protein